jgi:hypothetical protein
MVFVKDNTYEIPCYLLWLLILVALGLSVTLTICIITKGGI